VRGESDFVKFRNKCAAYRDMPYCTGGIILALVGLRLV
jgi:hypothetical protein